MPARETRDSRDDEMAYILDYEDLPVYVGKGLGDMLYEDAVELSVIKRKVKGLPADLEFIHLVAPPPKKLKRGVKSPHTPRASRNNPYICGYCAYRSTRRDNMKKHLEKVHDAYFAENSRLFGMKAAGCSGKTATPLVAPD